MQETSVAKYVLEVIYREDINARDVFEDQMNFNATGFTQIFSGVPEETIVGKGAMNL